MPAPVARYPHEAACCAAQSESEQLVHGLGGPAEAPFTELEPDCDDPELDEPLGLELGAALGDGDEPGPGVGDGREELPDEEPPDDDEPNDELFPPLGDAEGDGQVEAMATEVD